VLQVITGNDAVTLAVEYNETTLAYTGIIVTNNSDQPAAFLVGPNQREFVIPAHTTRSLNVPVADRPQLVSSLRASRISGCNIGSRIPAS